MSTLAGHSAHSGVREKVHVTAWAVFGSVTLLVVGAFNLINGYSALQNADFFKSDIVYTNLTFWGWAFLIWGALQLIAGCLVLAGHLAGNYIGVFLAATSAILWFFMIFAAPWAAFIGVGVSLLVLYSLTIGANPEA